MKKRMITAVLTLSILLTNILPVMAQSDTSVIAENNYEDTFNERIESDGSYDIGACDHIHGSDHEHEIVCDADNAQEEDLNGMSFGAHVCTGVVVTAEDGSQYFCPDSVEEEDVDDFVTGDSEDRVYDRAFEDTEVEINAESVTEEINGWSSFVDISKYKIIYSSEKVGMLTEEGGWITPEYCTYLLYPDGHKEVTGVKRDYYNDNYFNIDRIQYIKDRLKVNDINDADPQDVDYLINFILPYNYSNCNYAQLYLMYGDYEETKDSFIDGSKWRCPLCGEEYEIERDYSSEVEILEGGNRYYIWEHFNGCQLREEDKYWTCDDCGETFELRSSVFIGHFRGYDEAGSSTITDHNEWCTDREGHYFHCDICGEDILCLRRGKGQWDHDWIIFRNKDGSAYYRPKEVHIKDCQIEQAAKNIISEVITDDMNELEKAWYLYKWIIDNVTYDYKDVQYGYYVCSEEDFSTRYSDEPAIGTEAFKELYFVKEGIVYKYFDYSEKELELIQEYGQIYYGEAFGCLVQTDAVCAGNSRGYVWLLEDVGIKAYYKASTELNHAWVTVKLNGNWYNVDPTHRYFMKSDKYKGFDEVDIYYSFKNNMGTNTEIDEDVRCLDESYDNYSSISQRYEAMYGKAKPERAQDSEYDKRGLDSINDSMFQTVSVDMVINSANAVMIVGDKAALQIPGYDTGSLYSKSKKASLSGGVIYANKKGNCKVLTGGGKNKRTVCKIRIESPKLKSVTKIKEGMSKTVKLRGTKQAVIYDVADPKIATVSSDGTVTAKKNGTTILTAVVAGHTYTGTIIVQ
ncbi:MAG: hypothetical protein IJM23_04055 [Lachnospiraceae bacterium]|nr:hypothetical protein [Lachnospiraceae bacterium]